MKYLFIILLFIAVKAAGQTSYYVSNAGSDANNGESMATPWQTLAKVSATITNGSTVYLNRSDTFVGSLNITKTGITIMPYGMGANPIITGLVDPSTISSTGWQVNETNSSIETVQLSSPLSSLNMVLLNDVMQNIGRYPNKGYIPFNSFALGSPTSSITSSTSPPSSLTSGTVVIRNNHWLISQNPITSVSGSTITYTPAYSSSSAYAPVNNNGFFIENNFNTLDVNGEWFFDPTAANLSVFLNSTTDVAHIKIPTIDDLVIFHGADGSSISNISIVGANVDGIFVENTNGLSVANCSIGEIGQDGIHTQINSSSVVVSNCNIHNCYNDGIFAVNTPKVTLTSDTVHSIGLDPGRGEADGTGLTGVFTQAKSNSTGMKIDSTGYIGIEFMGDSSSVKNSLINHALLQKEDAGGIYTIPSTAQTFTHERSISGNVVMNCAGNTAGCADHATVNLGMGIYLDLYSSQVTVNNNTVTNAGCAGIYLNDINSDTITNNTCYNDTLHAIWFNDNVVGSGKTPGNTVGTNLFCSANGNYVLDGKGNNASQFPGSSKYINNTTTGLNFSVDTLLTMNQAITLAAGVTYSDFWGNSYTNPLTLNFLKSVLYFQSGTLSTDATLSNLTISQGTLVSSFTSTTTGYTDAVLNTVTSVTVTPTASNSSEAIFFNGTQMMSGTTTAMIPLAVGTNSIPVQVIAADGTTTQTYTIIVTRVRSSDANLSNLTISNGTLSPAFTSLTQNYADTVGNSIASVTVTPTLHNATATVTVDSTVVTSGTASAGYMLSVGANVIPIQVTAADSTPKTYHITVTRLPSSDATLAGLTISNGTLTSPFASSTLSYTDTVSNSITSVTITPTINEGTATIKVNGITVTSGTASSSIMLTAGSNTITTVVTAGNGVSTKTYTITVTRAASSIATLYNLTISSGTLVSAFASSTTAYTDAVANTVSTLKVTPTTSDATATVKVNGTTVSSGVASPSISLMVGTNTITTVVKAGDGVSTQTYTITVTRAASIDANLSNLTITGDGSLTPAFTSLTQNYTDDVSNAFSTVTVTPTVHNALATVTVDDTTVTSGTASRDIHLTVGTNRITIVVTAPDHMTVKTYAITVTRASSEALRLKLPAGFDEPTVSPALAEEGPIVHQAVSPNGDGINDFLQIDGIAAYPDNKLMIMNNNGNLVYEAKGYDNLSRLFDGHSNKTGAMQPQGTYFYSFSYKANGVSKYKWGFIVLKY